MLEHDWVECGTLFAADFQSILVSDLMPLVVDELVPQLGPHFLQTIADESIDDEAFELRPTQLCVIIAFGTTLIQFGAELKQLSKLGVHVLDLHRPILTILQHIDYLLSLLSRVIQNGLALLWQERRHAVCDVEVVQDRHGLHDSHLSLAEGKELDLEVVDVMMVLLGLLHQGEHCLHALFDGLHLRRVHV